MPDFLSLFWGHSVPNSNFTIIKSDYSSPNFHLGLSGKYLVYIVYIVHFRFSPSLYMLYLGNG